jgi:hypothetical protein
MAAGAFGLSPGKAWGAVVWAYAAPPASRPAAAANTIILRVIVMSLPWLRTRLYVLVLEWFHGLTLSRKRASPEPSRTAPN